MTSRFAWASVAAAALVPAAAHAHHAAFYDEQSVVAIEGVIRAVAWVNPHVRLTLETRGADGSTEQWNVEGTSRNVLERWGVAADSFALGGRVRVQGLRSRSARNELLGASASLRDGREVPLWPSVAARHGLVEIGEPERLFPAPRQASPPFGSEAVVRVDDAAGPRGIFRVWTPQALPERVALSALPLTARARAAAAEYQPLEDDPALRCEAPGMPRMLVTAYPIEFVERDEHILMRFEEWDGERTIYMNPRRGPAMQAHSWTGVSFGRWEGETLAIFTTYIDYPFFDDVGTPQSAAVAVLERYTPREDGGRIGLEWSMTVTDAATFTEPAVRRGFMAYEPGEVVRPYNCTLVE